MARSHWTAGLDQLSKNVNTVKPRFDWRFRKMTPTNEAKRYMKMYGGRKRKVKITLADHA